MLKEIYNNLPTFYGAAGGELDRTSCYCLTNECRNLIDYNPQSNYDIYYKIIHNGIFFISADNNIIGCSNEYISIFEQENMEYSTSPYNEVSRFTLPIFRNDKEFHLILNHINDIIYKIKLQNTPDVSNDKVWIINDIFANYNLFLIG